MNVVWYVLVDMDKNKCGATGALTVGELGCSASRILVGMCAY